MRAYEGYFENGNFYPIGRKIHTSGRRRAFLTVLDEQPTQLNEENYNAFFDEFERLTNEAKDEEKELRAAWIKKLTAAISLSSDEELPDIPRSTVMRDPIDFSDMLLTM